MKKSIYLFTYLSIFLSVNLNGQVIDRQALEKGTSIQRNTIFNLDEIKVRWKKAALENCPGVPCVVSPPAPSFTCGTSTITDVDNNIYNTVLIGTQCWTKENLKVTKFNDGTTILLDASGGSAGNVAGQTWSGQTIGAYTIYANESSSGMNATNYGFLYNWYAAKGIITPGGSPIKNICPTGWHVPTDPEWNIMIQTLDPSQAVNSGNVLTFQGNQSTIAGGMLKSTSNLWTATTGANNSSDFSALPGGTRDNIGRFLYIFVNALFWSSTEESLSNAWIRSLSLNSDLVRARINKSNGTSVRCLKD